MLGYKAPRLEGMKSTSPLRCLLVKLNCIGYNLIQDGVKTNTKEKPLLLQSQFAALTQILSQLIITFSPMLVKAREIQLQTYAAVILFSKIYNSFFNELSA